MNGPRQFCIPLAFAIAATVAGACGSSESARRSRGEDLLKATSTQIAGAQALSFSVDETTERVTPSGEKRLSHVVRRLTLRRPDRLWFRTTGDRDVEGFYDGARMTLLFHGEKAFGIVPTPGNLDDTIHVLSERYDIPLTIGDLLMTDPHQSMISTQTTGGWQDEEDVGGVRSARLAWHHPNVDWSIWIPVSGDPLPTKLFVNYKTRRRLVTALFTDWNLTPTVAEDTFQSRIPDDYEGIAMIQRAAAVPDEPGAAQSSTPQE